MQELEKILKEIKEVLEENKVIELNGDCTVDRCIIDVALAWDSIKAIIHNHINDGWIPVEERLPEESLNSVIGWDEYRERCCFVQYYGGKWSLRADREPIKIIAWRPLPEPYSPERSKK